MLQKQLTFDFPFLAGSKKEHSQRFLCCSKFCVLKKHTFNTTKLSP